MASPTLLRRASAGSLSSTALAQTNHDKGEKGKAVVMAEPSVLLRSNTSERICNHKFCSLRAIIDRG